VGSARPARPPLVSAILPLSDSRRAACARQAVAAFQSQTYPACELVLVNGTKTPLLGEAVAGVRELLVQPGTAGGLRNLGVQEARGEWLAQWDDDDWSHPDRLLVQMAARREGRACLLDYQARVAVQGEDVLAAAAVKAPEGARGTLLWPAGPARFRDGAAWEDALFLAEHFSGRVVLVPGRRDGLPLHSAFWHGLNATPLLEFMAAGGAALDPVETQYVGMVLARYGLNSPPRLPGPDVVVTSDATPIVYS